MKKALIALSVAAAVAIPTVAAAPAASASTGSFYTYMVKMHPAWKVVNKGTSARLSTGICNILKKQGYKGIDMSMDLMESMNMSSDISASVVIVAVGEVCPSMQRHVDAYIDRGATA